MLTAGLSLGDTSGTNTPAQNLSSREGLEGFLIRVSPRSRWREVEELKRPVECWERKQLPWGMSQSCTFSYKCACQAKTTWTKLSPKAGTAQIPVPALCGVHPSGTTEKTETSLETLKDEKAREKGWGKVCGSTGIRRRNVSPFWPASIRSCLGLTCSQLLLIQKLISCGHFTAVHNKDFAQTWQEWTLHGKGWLCRATLKSNGTIITFIPAATPGALI